MDPDRTKRRLLALVAALQAAAPTLFVGNVPELVDVGELKMALENLCDHLGDQLDGACPASVYPALRSALVDVGVDRRFWPAPPVRAQLEQGKQVGKSVDIERNGRLFYLCVAVQKIDERYKVIVDEIDHEKMASEDFAREDERWFETLDEAFSFVAATTPVDPSELAPRKGQKWF